MAHPAATLVALNWLAPRTEHRRIIAAKPWLPAACARAVDLFEDHTLKLGAAVLASAHEAAVDYIVQAPVLAVAAATKTDLDIGGNRDRLTARFNVLCAAQPRLKDLVAFYGLAPQLRRLHGRSLRRSHRELLTLLSTIPPSPLSQCIPERADEQSAWFAALEHWRVLAQRTLPRAEWIVAWAAQRHCHRHATPGAAEIIDFATQNRRSFNPDWSFAEAAAACQRWHNEVVQRRHEDLFSPERLMAEADYGPLPLASTIDEHRFVALRSRLEIFDEGRVMKHCVATYAGRVFEGRCWLYSVRRGEDRVATLELVRWGPYFKRAQIKSVLNANPEPATTRAADRFIAGINEHLEAEARRPPARYASG